MLFEDYRFGNKERTSSRVLFPKKDHTISTFAAISLILCTNNGSNCFTTERFFYVGLLNNIIASLFPLFLVQLSFQIYIRTWRFNTDISYPESLQDAFGGKSGFIIRLMLILSLFNCICFNCYDIYVFSQPFTNYFWPDNKLANNRFLHIYLLSIISVFPTLFLRHFSQLVVPSIIANICVVAVHVIMAIFAYGSIKERGFSPDGQTILCSSNFMDSVNCFSYFIYIYYVHPIMCNLAPELKASTQGGIVKVSLIANLLSWFVNFLGGYLGWFYFFGTSGGAVNVALYPNSLLKALAGLFGCINTMITNACLNYLNGIEISKLFTGTKVHVDTPWSGILVSLSFGLAAAIASKTFLDIVTSVCQLMFLVVCILIPPAAYIKMYGVKSFWGVVCIILIILLIVVGALTLYAVFTRPTER